MSEEINKKEKAIFLTARAVKSLRSKMANNICGPFQTNNNEILEIGRDSGVGSRYVLMNFRPNMTTANFISTPEKSYSAKFGN